jgi:hypothetical protein
VHVPIVPSYGMSIGLSASGPERSWLPCLTSSCLMLLVNACSPWYAFQIRRIRVTPTGTRQVLWATFAKTNNIHLNAANPYTTATTYLTC